MYNKYTAGFNAWRNYQNLYGEKDYVLIHFAPDPKSYIRQSVAWFEKQYLTGQLVFVARNPADWLYSSIKLKNSYRYTDNLEKVLEDYMTFYREFNTLFPENSIALEFDELVTDSEMQLTKVCANLGIEWNINMKKTTLNNCLVPQNSSDDTDVYHYQPSTSVFGKEKKWVHH